MVEINTYFVDQGFQTSEATQRSALIRSPHRNYTCCSCRRGCARSRHRWSTRKQEAASCAVHVCMAHLLVLLAEPEWQRAPTLGAALANARLTAAAAAVAALPASAAAAADGRQLPLIGGKSQGECRRRRRWRRQLHGSRLAPGAMAGAAGADAAHSHLHQAEGQQTVSDLATTTRRCQLHGGRLASGALAGAASADAANSRLSGKNGTRFKVTNVQDSVSCTAASSLWEPWPAAPPPTLRTRTYARKECMLNGCVSTNSRAMCLFRVILFHSWGRVTARSRTTRLATCLRICQGTAVRVWLSQPKGPTWVHERIVTSFGPPDMLGLFR